jgi:hypothetical protein
MLMKSRESQTPPDYANDITVYEPTKYLGILTADHLERPPREYLDAGMPLDPEAPMIDLHINPYAPPSALGAEAGRTSLRMLADYLEAHGDKIPPQQVVGLTHPRLGRLATRFGFEPIPVQPGRIPVSLVKKITGMTYSPLAAVGQSTPGLIERFGSNNSENRKSKQTNKHL